MTKIENHLKNKISVYLINRRINHLLKFVPKNHLIGLKKIVIVEMFGGKQKSSSGLYWKKKDNISASIEISFLSVYDRKPLLLFIPFVGNIFLGQVLYHEIGHHHHHCLKHGIKKGTREQYAENYKKEVLKKAFWKWRIILRFVTPFVRYMANRTKPSIKRK